MYLGVGLVAMTALSVAMPARAEDRPAPEYFVASVMATTTARQLALACPAISINLPVVSKDAGVVMDRLDADGFDTGSQSLGMIDPSDEFLARQSLFLAKHDLSEGASEAAVCAAARAEMGEGTQIGLYLVEVAQ